MQTQKKWVLTLMTALGAMSCGGPTSPADTYQGFIDAVGLDSKFQPNGATCAIPTVTDGSAGKEKCYLPTKGAATGSDFYFQNLGYLLATDKNLVKDAAGLIALPASTVKAISYDFPEACTPGKAYDVRTDAFPQDVQYTLFDTLPLTNTATNSLVTPLVHVQPWTGVSGIHCNAIKDAQSLTGGTFGGAAGDDTIALRAVIDITVVYNMPPAGTPPEPPFSWGWYRGLQLAWLNGGTVPVGADGNLGMMDGVWLKPTTSGAKPTDATAKLVFQSRPGDATWSPVVRLREIAAPTTTPTSLCYTAPTTPCPANSVDMSKATTFTGVLFIVPSQQ